MGRTCGHPRCDRPFYAKGYCNLHWQRQHKHGTTEALRRPGERANSKPISLSEADLAWLAGLLEGEGSFMMQKAPNNGVMYRYPKIVVDMTDEDVIERVANFFGNSHYKFDNKKRPSHKPLFRAQVMGTRAVQLMEDLLPWMGVRRSEKIKELLNMKYGRTEVSA